MNLNYEQRSKHNYGHCQWGVPQKSTLNPRERDRVRRRHVNPTSDDIRKDSH